MNSTALDKSPVLFIDRVNSDGIHQVLVCFAVKEEARFFKPTPRSRIRAAVAITGLGQQNARRTIEKLLDSASPALVLTCGFAGGLNPELRRGDIVFSCDDGLPVSDSLRRFGARGARFHCSARVAVTAEEKRRLWLSTNADAVEMESEVIRNLCRERGIPSATIRVISDAADEDLPLDFNALLTPAKEINYLWLATQVARSPAKIPRLLKLGKHTKQAAVQLADCLGHLLQ
jgi:nucleoside phosphorylase